MANRQRRNINMESLIAKGEMRGPDGYRGETANGTAFWRGSGWNREDYRYDRPEAPTGGVWPAGRSTRTGE